MTKYLGPGLHDISAERYHGDPCERPSLSASLAHLLLSATPRHAWWASGRLNPDYEPEEKAHFDVGSAFHELMTGKGRGIEVIPFKDYKSKAAQERRDEARAIGKVPLLTKQDVEVRRMVTAARWQMRQHGIGDPFEGGENEVTLIWEQDGVMNRLMIDCLDRENRVAYDLKTCAGYAEPEGWVRTAMSHSVDVRAAHYLDGLSRVLGGHWRYRFVPIEKEAPHCLSVLELSEGALFMAQKKIERAREIWRHCLATNSWPAWSAEIAVVDPPAWHESKWLERESREQDFKQRTSQDVLAASIRWQAPQGVTP
ncbi:PD-(D/E)XK nuclease-like domain-containing protein [Rubellimicrobium arenae]|uniref:PD-(D/E)XK nuclease-like domain-containing protein n=1 Tax=Rubellimicrobium arenae TaxID=2817372 RepID=UPI001B312FF8|nr:PD-(D/E)XK nuclease-like domain-containing protein [Rubellimicrobium arenae]